MTAAEAQPPPARRSWWPFGRSHDSTTEAARKASEATEQERLIVEKLVDLRDMEVREVMTPRVDVVALTMPVSAQDIVDAVRVSGHSCFPVVQDDLDDLVGVLFVNDLFRSAEGRRLIDDRDDDTGPSPLAISRRLRQPLLVPESLQVLEALAAFRTQRRAFAIVVDEHGGVAGVLTLKDLLEPLVGDLHDEFDAAEEPDAVRVDPTRWLLDGRANVDDVAERLGVSLPEGDYVTLGGYLFDAFGHIPEEGERLSFGGWELRVVQMDRRRVAKVVARKLPEGDDGTEQRSPASPTGSPLPLG
jgi:CBS domain containing-hemolysin-like protein